MCVFLIYRCLYMCETFWGGIQNGGGLILTYNPPTIFSGGVIDTPNPPLIYACLWDVGC